MAEDANSKTERTVTDHEQIRELAEANEAVPVYADGPDGDPELRIATDPNHTDGERVTWEQFFERLERTGRVLRYRPSDTKRGSPATFEIVGADDTSEGSRPAEAVDDSTSAEGEQIATGDTGDDEPVVFDTTESEHGDPDDDRDASIGDSDGPARASAGLVLDEIHERTTESGQDLSNEYLVFVNESEERIDLSGWTVENDTGKSFRFPPETDLDPGERITLHSGGGENTEGHLYWNAEEPLWRSRQTTVTVRTPAGDRIL